MYEFINHRCINFVDDDFVNSITEKIRMNELQRANGKDIEVRH